MQIELSEAAAATIAGLVAEDDDIQEIVYYEDGPNSEAIIAPNEVWKEIRENFPVSLFKEHGNWVGKDKENDLSCPDCRSTNIRTYVAEPDHGYCLSCGIRFDRVIRA